MERIVTVFGASTASAGDPHWKEGELCGRLLAEAGYAVATGGYGGLMEAVSKGARIAGGRAIGVTAPGVFPGRDAANVHVTEELRAASLTERIHELLDVADAAVALHGSIGTFTELVMAWNLAFVAKLSDVPPLPIVAVGSRWKQLIGELEGALETSPGLVTCVDTVEAAVEVVKQRLGEMPDSSINTG